MDQRIQFVTMMKYFVVLLLGAAAEVYAVRSIQWARDPHAHEAEQSQEDRDEQLVVGIFADHPDSYLHEFFESFDDDEDVIDTPVMITGTESPSRNNNGLDHEMHGIAQRIGTMHLQDAPLTDTGIAAAILFPDTTPNTKVAETNQLYDMSLSLIRKYTDSIRDAVDCGMHHADIEFVCRQGMLNIEKVSRFNMPYYIQTNIEKIAKRHPNLLMPIWTDEMKLEMRLAHKNFILQFHRALDVLNHGQWVEKK